MPRMTTRPLACCALMTAALRAPRAMAQRSSTAGSPECSARCLLHFVIDAHALRCAALRCVACAAVRSISVRYPDVLHLHGLAQKRPALARTVEPVELVAVVG